MTYIYVCDPCKTGFHGDCLNHQEQLPLPEGYCGGGMCICDHRANHQTVEEALESRRENTKADS